MKVRTWRARAAADRAQLYPQYLAGVVLPKLRTIPGYLGAYLLRRAEDQGGVRRANPLDVTRGSPALRRACAATLIVFDATVTHHEVLISPSDLPTPAPGDR